MERFTLSGKAVVPNFYTADVEVTFYRERGEMLPQSSWHVKDVVMSNPHAVYTVNFSGKVKTQETASKTLKEAILRAKKEISFATFCGKLNDSVF